MTRPKQSQTVNVRDPDGRRRTLLTFGAISAWSFLPLSASAETQTLHIKVELPTDRLNTGKLWLLSHEGKQLVGPFNVYGRSDSKTAKAHNNPGRLSTLPYGDTPTGNYEIVRAISTGDGTAYRAKSYGPKVAFVLKPVTGDALSGAKNGRIGLLIHGGAFGKNNRLRATHGCLRIGNDDIERLLKTIKDAMLNHNAFRCEVIQLAASIGGLGDEEAGEDVGDPPPGITELLKPGGFLP